MAAKASGSERRVGAEPAPATGKTPVALAMALLRTCACRSSLAAASPAMGRSLSRLLNGKANIAGLVEDLGE